MSAARKLTTKVYTLDGVQQMNNAAKEAITAGVRPQEIARAIDLLRRVHTGDVSSMVARKDAKATDRLWIKGCKWVK